LASGIIRQNSDAKIHTLICVDCSILNLIDGVLTLS
jgi:hypothetical protein